MKFLIVDDGKNLDLALKLQAEGHEIRYISGSDTGGNLVVTYTSWKDRIGWSDMVIFTGCDHSTYVEVLKRKGKPVIGVTKFLAQLKEDLVFRNQILTGLKLDVPEHEYFNNWTESREYLKEEGSYTFRPITKGLPIYKSDTVEDMLAMLDYLAESTPTPDFILEKTPKGIQLEVGAWYNGFKFVRPIVNVLGNVLRFTKTNRLFSETLIYLDPYLKNSKYTGYVGMSCIIDKGKKPIVCDILFGFPFPHFQLQDQIVKENWGNFLFNLSQGSLNTIKVMPRWCYGVPILTGDVPIFLGEMEKFSHLVECKRVGNHLHASGILPVFTCGHAMTIKEAHKRAVDVADRIRANSKTFSKDITEIERYKKLKKLGYLDVNG